MSMNLKKRLPRGFAVKSGKKGQLIEIVPIGGKSVLLSEKDCLNLISLFIAHHGWKAAELFDSCMISFCPCFDSKKQTLHEPLTCSLERKPKPQTGNS